MCGVNSHERTLVHGRGVQAALAQLMPSISLYLEVYFCKTNDDIKCTNKRNSKKGVYLVWVVSDRSSLEG